MNRRTLLRRLGAGTAALSATAGLASADTGPVVFEETELDGETTYVRADISESQRREMELEGPCECPDCSKCFNCTCDDLESLQQSFDRPVVVQ